MHGGARQRGVKSASRLSARLRHAPETLPLLRAEYKPKEAPLFRLLDLALILVLSVSSVVFDGQAAAQRVASAAGSGARSLEALAAAADAGTIQAGITFAACLALVLLLLFATPGGPYLKKDAWKRPVRIGSLVLVGTASILNAVVARVDAHPRQQTDAARAVVVVLSWLVFTLIVATVVSLFLGFLFTTVVSSASKDADDMAEFGGAPRITTPRTNPGRPDLATAGAPDLSSANPALKLAMANPMLARDAKSAFVPDDKEAARRSASTRSLLPPTLIKARSVGRPDPGKTLIGSEQLKRVMKSSRMLDKSRHLDRSVVTGAVQVFSSSAPKA